MGQRNDIVRIALREVGYKEGPNNINKYGAWYGMNYQPYCAMFVSWCANEAHISTSIIPKMSYVPNIYQFYANKNRFYEKGKYTPKPGDLAIFGNCDHIGIVEKVIDGVVYTIEGNTSSDGNSSNGDGVYRRHRGLNSGWIKGYCVPAYLEEETMDVKDLKIMDYSREIEVVVSAININGTNYVKLRDVEKLAPVTVDFDGKQPTICLNYGHKE